MTDNLQLAHLVDACRWIGAKGWAPATGGNMSVRQDEHLCWLSESGKDKGSLTTDDFLQVEIATNRAPSGRKPSAETGLHTLIYRLFPEANAVLLRDGRGASKAPGEFRRSQNWIGGTRPGNAYFVPPPAENVLECLGDLEKFLHDMPQTTPPLTQLGVDLSGQIAAPLLDFVQRPLKHDAQARSQRA